MMNGLIAGILIVNAQNIPAVVTSVASAKLIPVVAHAAFIASKFPPSSLTLLAICIEKSTPTPTRIEPTITVTSDN